MVMIAIVATNLAAIDNRCSRATTPAIVPARFHCFRLGRFVFSIITILTLARALDNANDVQAIWSKAAQYNNLLQRARAQ